MQQGVSTSFPNIVCSNLQNFSAAQQYSVIAKTFSHHNKTAAEISTAVANQTLLIKYCQANCTAEKNHQRSRQTGRFFQQVLLQQNLPPFILIVRYYCTMLSRICSNLRPEARFIFFPFLNAMVVGTIIIPNCWAKSGYSSTSSLHTFISGCLSAIESSSDCCIRQG